MYSLGLLIGAGTFAEVHEAYNRVTGEKFAAKIFNKNSYTYSAEAVDSEIKIFRKV